MARLQILVTTDFSAASMRAFDTAALLASRLDAQLTVLHVLAEVPAIPHGAPLAPPLQAPGAGQRRAEAEQQLVQLRQRFPAGLQVDTVLAEGPRVSAAIEQAARERDAALIVIASCGWNVAKSLFLGSTTEALLRQTRLPILVVPAGADARGLGLS